jgi:hypothetical protein
MYKTIKIVNNVIYADRTICSDDICDGKELAVWYRAAGYKQNTIRNIMSVKFPDMTHQQIKNAISNFAKTTGHTFRKYSDDTEWNQYYKDQAKKQWGKQADNSQTWTENRPLVAGDYRKRTGLNKAEKKLLRSIKK